MSAVDFVTVVTCKRGHAAGKRLINGVEQPFSAGTWFTVEEVPVAAGRDGPREFYALLEVTQRDRRRAILRGRVRDEHRHVLGTGAHVRKTCRPQPDGYPAIFEPAAHHWLMLDLDSFSLTWEGYTASPVDIHVVDDFARSLLPPEFCGTCHWTQLTAGAGIKPGGRCRLAFWLDRPVDDLEAKRWLRLSPVDHSLYSAVQLHYVANPVFTGSVADPVRERSLINVGYPEDVVRVPDHVSVPPPKPAPAPFRDFNPPRRGLAFKPTKAERYMLACLRNLADAPEGMRHRACVAVAAALFGLAKAGHLDPSEVAARVKGVMRDRGFVPNAPGRRDDREVDAALTWAWQHAEPRELGR